MRMYYINKNNGWHILCISLYHTKKKFKRIRNINKYINSNTYK